MTNNLCLSFLKLETQETSIRPNESIVSVRKKLKEDIEEHIQDYLISLSYPPYDHQKTCSCVLADNPYHYAKPRDLVELSFGTLKDNVFSYRLKDPFVVDNKTSESSQNVENIHFFAEKLPPTIEDLKEHQPTRGDVAELKSVIGEEVPYFL